MIYLESGGGDGPLVVLLHGSGASGAVWRPVLEQLSERGVRCRWLVPDLPGHGRSGWRRDYSPEGYAGAVAEAVGGFPAETRTPVVVVGHSLGGMIALALADGSRGFDVASVGVVAMKIVWTDEELERRAALAAKPPKIFPDAEQARELFGRVSGMRTAPFTEQDRASGVTSAPGGYRLSGDPGITAAPPATADELAALMRRTTCPVELACGDRDPGIDPADMEHALGRPVTVLPDTGHNAHIEQPGLVAELVERALRR